MYVKDHVSLEKLNKLARSEKNSRIARRIQIIILATQGYTAPGIALSLSLSDVPPSMTPVTRLSV